MPERPTIVILSAFYHPWMSGAERFVEEVALRLSARHRFLIITTRGRRSLMRREERPEGTVVRVGVGTRFDKWLYPLLAPFAAIREHPDLVHAVMESYAGIALVIFRLFFPRIRTLLTLQSGDLDSRVGTSFPAWLWRAIHRAPHRVTAISAFLARRATSLRGNELGVRVIPNGVDLALVSGVRSDIVPHRVAAIARLSPEKGVDVLIRAFALVRNTHPDATLALVGDGSERETLESLVRELGVSAAVTFHGTLPHRDALVVLAAAAVAALPSRAEGLGIAVLEAQALGVPIVASNVGGVPDVVTDGETGLLVPPGDAEALAAAIRKLFDDTPLRTRLAAAARTAAARFDWNTVADALETEYRGRTLPAVAIAASIWPPDPGGPATIAKAFAEEWSRRFGPVVAVVRSRTTLIGYAIELFRAVRRADIVFAQDASSAGFLATVIAQILQRPFIVRIGGDLLWERAAAVGRTQLGLQKFYDSGEWRHAPWIEKTMLTFVLRHAERIIFPSRWLPALYASVGLIPSGKGDVITNPIASIPSNDATTAPRRRQFVIVARLIPLKNLPQTLAACARVREGIEPFDLVIVGDGPEAGAVDAWIRDHTAGWMRRASGLSREELITQMRGALGVLLLSWSEVSPNVALEALALGTPVVLTRENGLHNELATAAIQVDPSDANAIEGAIRQLADTTTAAPWLERAAAFRWPQTVVTMTDEIQQILVRLLPAS